MSRYDGTSFTSLEALAGRNIYAMTEGPDGHMWFGESIPVNSDEGIFRYDGSTCSHVKPAAQSTYEWRLENIQVGLTDQRGNLWFGTRMGKVHRFDGNQWQVFPTNQPLSSPHVGSGVLALLEDRQGRIWCGTLGGGVHCYNGNDWTVFTTADGLASNRIHAILEDGRGHLWFGTFGGGVSRFDGHVFQTLTKQDGLSHDTVQAFLEDRHGHIWIATQGGITRYRSQIQPLQVRITDIVADQRYGPQAEIQLTSTHELVAFEFQGCSFTTQPDRMAYVYRLQGHQDQWRNTYIRRVEYQNLPLGRYTFQIKAVDRDLNYSEPIPAGCRHQPGSANRHTRWHLSRGPILSPEYVCPKTTPSPRPPRRHTHAGRILYQALCPSFGPPQIHSTNDRLGTT